ncbi:hypothetical protein IVB55_05765 [Bradyrhizobium sp. CW4]|nr:hypothetical protein [Bradyrhizobium sp. CW4]
MALKRKTCPTGARLCAKACQEMRTRSQKAKGRLFVAHASLGHVFVMAPNGETIGRIKSCGGATCRNLVLEAANGTLLITEILYRISVDG